MAAIALVTGCGDEGANRSGFVEVVAAAEAKILAVSSVRVAISKSRVGEQPSESDEVAYWQAPDRVRNDNDGRPWSLYVGDRLYTPKAGSPDRWESDPRPPRQEDAAKIANFPVSEIGYIADHASQITYDGLAYTATVPVGTESFKATIRISDGYIVSIRVAGTQSETTYNLSQFNTAPAVEAPAPEKVDVATTLPSCLAPTTTPTTRAVSKPGLACIDITTR
ncbi:MAG: hypothetical protein ABI658_31820 [Acidimicrobiales bacterium]